MSRRRTGFSGGGGDHQMRYDIGALEQRVYGLEQGVAGISSQIGALSSKLDERGRTQWGVLASIAGVVLTFVIALGGLAYWPIQAQQQDAKLVLARVVEILQGLPERFVTIRELDARAGRTQSDLTRLAADLRQIENVTVPRGEHAERWRALEASDAALQKQVDDLKRQFGDTFSLRDALIQMQRRMDNLEERRTSQGATR